MGTFSLERPRGLGAYAFLTLTGKFLNWASLWWGGSHIRNVFSRSWRLSLEAFRAFRAVLLRPLFLACGQLPPNCVLTGSSLCVCLCPDFLFR